jgi:hypothetical protein
VISATEALALPKTKLTTEEKEGADRLEITIEQAIREHMEFRGIDLEIKEPRPNVIAEVNQRLRAVGFVAQWQPMVQQNRFNPAAAPAIVGFKLSLSPGDAAYKEAAAAVLQ